MLFWEAQHFLGLSLENFPLADFAMSALGRDQPVMAGRNRPVEDVHIDSAGIKMAVLFAARLVRSGGTMIARLVGITVIVEADKHRVVRSMAYG